MRDVLNLQQGIIYGPVQSRRLGLSLGINIMPGAYKICPFNCVYCQYGGSRFCTRHLDPYIDDLPSPEEVEDALTSTLQSGVTADYLTFSGNGESSIHPGFPEMVERIVRIRDRYLPEAKTCILSNAVGVLEESVCEALNKLDVPIMKLDAGDEKTFRAINKPCEGLCFEDLLDGFHRLQSFLTQTLFVEGVVENVSRTKRECWIARLAELKPECAQIYSLDRPTASSGLTGVSIERLRKIALETTEQTGIPVKVY